MKIDIDLPIVEVIPQIKEHLATSNTLIVNAPPGAGKSTVVPIALMDEPWLQGRKILMLEPRRIAARAIAERMSDLVKKPIGNLVGYRIRFDSKVTSDTVIEVVTEGILTRMLQSDNALEEVAMVVFDEFHERSIHADVALALCREAQQILRPDLRIMIMSATLDMPLLTERLQCPTVVSKGRQYPVDVFYVGDQDPYLLSEMTASAVIKAAKAHDGDILVFLPGQGEILKCEGLLRPKLQGFAIHPLFGMLPQNKQRAAILPDRAGNRKVVLATNIAETSLTIEGVKVVIDSGFGRRQVFDPNSGLSRLETVAITRDSADQRAGRAGRLGPGVCYRMWTKATHDRLGETRVPEIEEADLAPLALEMAKWGISDPYELTWLSPPPKKAMAQARDILGELEAVDEAKITAHGEAMHRLPCHPRIAHMMIKAQEMDGSTDEWLALACDLASLLEERDPLSREVAQAAGIDINTRIETLRRYRKATDMRGAFSRIEKVASSYRKIFDTPVSNNPVDSFETGVLISFAYPERIACARPGNNAQFQLANGSMAMVGHKDDLSHEAWLAVANMDARQGMGKIFMASPLNPRDLAPLVKQRENISWDHREDKLRTALELRIGNIILKSTNLRDPDPELVAEAIYKAVDKEGHRLFDFDDVFLQLQYRLANLRTWNSDNSWPEISPASLVASARDWLHFYISDLQTIEDFKNIDLAQIGYQQLSYDQQQELNRLAPAKIKVPTGSDISLEYRKDNEPPILAVRIQEVFGLADTPAINDGQTSVLMHLLSPGFKPVQVTGDLRSFWDNTYFEVRKELKRRYPKHAWPDDPWAAQPIRGVPKRK